MLVFATLPASRSTMRDSNCPWREFAADRKCCDYCGGRLPPNRRNWCDDECAASYTYNHLWPSAKVAVWRRDSAACTNCGQFVLKGWADNWHPEYPQRIRSATPCFDDFLAHEAALKVFYRRNREAVGEVDHIIECNNDYNSGCQHHTDNLRLLCRMCHRSRALWSPQNTRMPLVIPGFEAAPWAHTTPQTV